MQRTDGQTDQTIEVTANVRQHSEHAHLCPSAVVLCSYQEISSNAYGILSVDGHVSHSIPCNTQLGIRDMPQLQVV